MNNERCPKCSNDYIIPRYRSEHESASGIAHMKYLCARCRYKWYVFEKRNNR